MRHDGYVFNIGFNKCGTTSLTAALNDLGIRTLHYSAPATGGNDSPRVRLVDLWRHNLSQGRRPFFGVDQKVRGFSDFYGEGCFRLLDQAYPGSKFILTVRTLEDWLRSREEHVRRNQANPNYRGGFRVVDHDGWTRLYHRHIADSRNHFASRPQDFLIVDIPSGDGWEPLCEFLGVPVPDHPFPWGNRTRAHTPGDPTGPAAAAEQ